MATQPPSLGEWSIAASTLRCERRQVGCLSNLMHYVPSQLGLDDELGRHRIVDRKALSAAADGGMNDAILDEVSRLMPLAGLLDFHHADCDIPHLLDPPTGTMPQARPDSSECCRHTLQPAYVEREKSRSWRAPGRLGSVSRIRLHAAELVKAFLRWIASIHA